jgi:hypothetical protein
MSTAHVRAGGRPRAGRLAVERLPQAGPLVEVVPSLGDSFGTAADGPREPHRHDYHQICWTRSGSGLHLIDGRPSPSFRGPDGGLPWRYHPDGSVAMASPAKTTGSFTVGGAERTYILEHAIVTDFALVRAWKGDRHGNLVFHRAARNFNPLAAMAGRVTIAEVEHFFEAGELDPDEIHLPGVFVQRVVALTPAQAVGKPVEKRTTRGERSLTGAHSGQGTGG